MDPEKPPMKYIQSEAVQQMGTSARDEVKEIMQPTYIPEIKSGSEPGTA